MNILSGKSYYFTNIVYNIQFSVKQLHKHKHKVNSRAVSVSSIDFIKYPQLRLHTFKIQYNIHHFNIFYKEVMLAKILLH